MAMVHRIRAKRNCSRIPEIAHAALRSDAINAKKYAQHITHYHREKRKVRPKELFINESNISVEGISERFSSTSQALQLHVTNDASSSKNGSSKRKRRPPTCGNCRKPGHKIQTCPEKLQ